MYFCLHVKSSSCRYFSYRMAELTSSRATPSIFSYLYRLSFYLLWVDTWLCSLAPLPRFDRSPPSKPLFIVAGLRLMLSELRDRARISHSGPGQEPQNFGLMTRAPCDWGYYGMILSCFNLAIIDFVFSPQAKNPFPFSIFQAL